MHQQRQAIAGDHEGHWVLGNFTYGGGCSGLPEVRCDWFCEGYSATCLMPALSNRVRYVYHTHSVIVHSSGGGMPSLEERAEPCLEPRDSGWHPGPYCYEDLTALQLNTDGCDTALSTRIPPSVPELASGQDEAPGVTDPVVEG